MKILFLTNLYPPHHAGTYNLRAQAMAATLQLRGHVVLVLTSNHGLLGEQRDADVERRLFLNGVYEHPLTDGYRELSSLEIHNHRVLNETLAEFQPDLVYVWSLKGLSKSLILALRNSRKPFFFDVDDHWIANEMREDPWLMWWNGDKVPFQVNVMRRGLEMSGQRDRLEASVPTRCQGGLDRLPGVFGKPPPPVEPNSIGAFQFNRIFFCSHALKNETEQAGFRVGHADVILPGIPTHQYHGEIKPTSAPVKKLAMCCNLHSRNGVMTALQAMQHLQEQEAMHNKFVLDIYGRGDSDHVAQLRTFVAINELPVHFLTVSNINKDMPSIYRLHDAFLYTAEWEEPFAIEPIEAMACGMPVIGSPVGGFGEFLKHGHNGLVYQRGDPVDLANRIVELSQQPQSRCRMADTGQQEVLATFNETGITDQVENFMNGTIEIWNA